MCATYTHMQIHSSDTVADYLVNAHVRTGLYKHTHMTHIYHKVLQTRTLTHM